MSDLFEKTPGALSLAHRIEVNEACERFENDWRGGRQPRIEELLGVCSVDSRLPLLSELLALELELRIERKESPTEKEYVDRFPGQRSSIEAAFREVNACRATTFDSEPPATLDLSTIRPSRGELGPLPAESTWFGDYLLIEEINRGGMGVVYKARQRGLNRVVALKMILSGHFASADEKSRFRLEAELAANLDHPNIVPIYEVGEHEGYPFFSMKLVEGGSLSREIVRLVDDPLAAARVLARVARAVHFAHSRGFLHCDLKPANILMDANGQPHITDFGLARRVESESALTVSGALMGTPSYMAPEQASGGRKALTSAADVYGLGAILYELLTGRPPFRAPSVMETVVMVLEREPESPRGLCPKVPRELEQICLKCLEKAPKERFHSAEELAENLDQFLRGESVTGSTFSQSIKRWTRREPELVSRLGGLAIIILLTQYNYLMSPQPIFGLHYRIQLVFVLWAAASCMFQMLLRRGRFADLARYAWSATDMVALSWVLFAIDSSRGSLLVGYPLLIAASGLWSRIRLVWFTTGLAMLSYLLLFLASYFLKAGVYSDIPAYPNIVLAALAVTGFAVARQVKRFWALSSFYENRPAR